MAKFQLPIRAESDRRYYRRFILLGLGALGFALYCVYDGSYAWPRGQEIYDAYKAIPEEVRKEKWPEVAAENGWAVDSVPKKRHTDADIMGQFFMAVPISLVGLWFLAGVFMSRGSWIEATKTGVNSSWGKSFAWDEVTQIDKKKWRSKGIAKVQFASNGRKGSFTIDDYKFIREPTGMILKELESRVPREAIINGPSEAELEAAGPGSDPVAEKL